MIYSNGKVLEIPCVEAEQVIDPTGCGDAYRAGLLYGIVNGMDWETTGRLAALMGALKIASRGGQNHAHSRDEIVNRFREQFGTNLE
jgi:adenosine kinase